MAKKFSFTLQKVLDLRSFEEKQAEIALGQAITARTMLEHELESLAAERVRASLEKHDIPIQDYILIDSYITRLDTKKERLLEEITKASLVVDQKKELYIEAHKKKEVLHKLREKKEETYRKDCAVREETEILNRPESPLRRENLQFSDTAVDSLF